MTWTPVPTVKIPAEPELVAKLRAHATLRKRPLRIVQAEAMANYLFLRKAKPKERFSYLRTAPSANKTLPCQLTEAQLAAATGFSHTDSVSLVEVVYTALHLYAATLP